MRNKLLSTHQNASTEKKVDETAEQTVDSKVESKESLSYALNQFRHAQRGPASVTGAVIKNDTNIEFQEFVRQLRGLASDPKVFSDALEVRLSKLTLEHIVERTTLMQEMFLVLNYESHTELRRLLKSEQYWLAAHSKNIQDKAKLSAHINEIVKITTRTHDQSSDRFKELKDMAQLIKMDAYALRAFRQALVVNSEWDITDIFDNIPEDLKTYLQVNQK